MQWFHINKNCNALASNGVFNKNQRPSNQAGNRQDTRLYFLSLSRVITSVLSYFTHSFIVNVS